jgi:hypothetical protein
MAELASRAFRTKALCLAVANATAGGALMFGDPGTSPALLFLHLLAPLPAWGCGFAAAAVALIVRRHLAGHTIAVPLWSMTAVGAVIGLIEGTTRSPAGTVLFTGLLVAVALLHVNGMWFRRRQRLMIKEAQQRR